MEVDGEQAEAIADVLDRYGYQGFVSEQAGFYIDTWEDEIPRAERWIMRAYFPDDEAAEGVKRQIEGALGFLNMMYPMPAPQFRVIDEENWAEAWKANYHPLRVGRRIFIRPIWIEEAGRPGDVVIALDAGQAFGTGTHPSTQLVLEAAEDLLDSRSGLSVLDLGSGSGILAIAAAKLGAAHVMAVDTDSIAVRSSAENAVANGVQDRIAVRESSLEYLLTAGEGGAPLDFDLALVNILAKTIIKMSGEGLGRVVRPGGSASSGSSGTE
jgi:ribosomal protein L11 methyltransferase